MCVDFLYKFCLKYFSFKQIQREVFVNVEMHSCKFPVILVRFLMKLKFSKPIFKKKKTSNIECHKNQSSRSRVLPCGWTDGRTDRHDDVNRLFFRSFANPPIKCEHTTTFSAGG